MFELMYRFNSNFAFIWQTLSVPRFYTTVTNIERDYYFVSIEQFSLEHTF